ncbi:hypothetical protein NRIC_03660 [Enterococcus florum]|uniref:Uncharacterized protein n=1 Tax=Enterococcus florum TaxID=2480627 RepID=A0A4P5P3Y1_9ENTE|nr:hypothetical protein [Enterococcus florum]GCF92475.1 hypothetical protein NRIC_03660 [Enterococcus florum]
MNHRRIMWQNIIRCLSGYYDHQQRDDQLAILNGMILFLETELIDLGTSTSSAETEMLKELIKKYESLDLDFGQGEV